MKKQVKLLSLLLCFVLLISTPATTLAGNSPAATQIKNIIYMIPDGGSMMPFSMADAVKEAGGFNQGVFPNATPIEQGSMYIEDYFVGAETTYCNNDAVTDSAASGTALSSGYKTNKTYVGVTPDGVPRANILEASQHLGKNTGMVVTFEWTNATPGTFSSHDISRYNMTTMSEQIVNQGIDLVFGSTHEAFADAEWFTDAALTERGYEIITSKEDLKDVKPGDRMWSKFPELLYFDTAKSASIPSLAEMTQAAITALDDGNENGFFLMVEGSTVDLAGHNSDAVNMVGEYLAFDKACEVAIEYAKKRTDTIVVILPDHDTGGMIWNDSKLESIVADIQKGVNPPAVSWEGNGSHTSRDGGIFMYVPEGIPYPEGIDPAKAEQAKEEFKATDYKKATTNLIDNTAITPYLANLIGADLDKISKDLFVDVTELGYYDEKTEIFTFNDYDGMTVKRNACVATYKGSEVDTNGEVALYIEGKFYVPRLLLDKVENKIKPVELSNIDITANYTDNTISLSGKIDRPSGIIELMAANEANKYSEFLSINANENGNYSVQMKPADIAGAYDLHMDFSKNSKSLPEITPFKPNINIPALSVVKNSLEVTSASQLYKQDIITLKMNGFDSNDGFKGILIAVQYDENGILTAVDCTNVNVNSADAEATAKLSLAAKPSQLSIVYWGEGRYGSITGRYDIQ